MKRAAIVTSIWDDDDFCALPERAQRMYFFLISQPKITLVGALDYMPERWATKAGGLSVGDVAERLQLLADARFVLLDYAVGEVVVRTLVRHDKARNWQAKKGMWSAWESVASKRLRRLLLDEMPDDLWTTEDVPVPDEALLLRDTPIEPHGPSHAEPHDVGVSEPGGDTQLRACAPAPPLSLDPSPLTHNPQDPTALKPVDNVDRWLKAEGPIQEVTLAIVEALALRSPSAFKDKLRGEAKLMRPKVVEGLSRWPNARSDTLAGWVLGERVSLPAAAVTDPAVLAAIGPIDEDGPPADPASVRSVVAQFKKRELA